MASKKSLSDLPKRERLKEAILAWAFRPPLALPDEEAAGRIFEALERHDSFPTLADFLVFADEELHNALIREVGEAPRRLSQEEAFRVADTLANVILRQRAVAEFQFVLPICRGEVSLPEELRLNRKLSGSGRVDSTLALRFETCQFDDGDPDWEDGLVLVGSTAASSAAAARHKAEVFAHGLVGWLLASWFLYHVPTGRTAAVPVKLDPPEAPEGFLSAEMARLVRSVWISESTPWMVTDSDGSFLALPPVAGERRSGASYVLDGIAWVAAALFQSGEWSTEGMDNDLLPQALALQVAGRLFARGVDCRDPGEGAMFLALCLESLLLDAPQNKDDLSARLQDAVALLLGRSSEDKDLHRRLVAMLYTARSEFVHTGSSAKATPAAATEWRELVGRVLLKFLIDFGRDCRSVIESGALRDPVFP